MKGRKGIIAIIITIIILCSAWVVIGFLKEVLPDVHLGKPYGWKTDWENSTFDKTWLTGKMNISLVQGEELNDALINFLKEHSMITLKFKPDHKVEPIGELSFIKPWDNDILNKTSKEDIATIKGSEIKTVDIYLCLFNCKIPIVLYDYLASGEHGEIELGGVFTFKIQNTNIKWEVPLEKKTIPINIHFLEKLNEIIDEIIKKQIDIEKELSSRLSLFISKERGSGTVSITPSIFKFKKKLHFFTTEITLDDYDARITNTKSHTVLGLKFTASSRELIFRLLPLHFKIYTNDVELGEITIKENNEESSKRILFQIIRRKTKDICIEIKLDNMMLDDSFASHVDNQEKTNLSIYFVRNGKICKNSPIFPPILIDDKISDIFGNMNWTSSKLSTSKLSINNTYLPQLLKETQLCIIFTIIVLIICLIAYYVLTRKK